MLVRYDNNILDIQASYTAVAKESGNAMYFLMNPAMDMKEISGNGILHYEVTQKPDEPLPYWRIDFKDPFTKGDRVVVQFDYQLDLVKLNHLNSDWIELNADKLWSPNYNGIDNEYTYETTLIGWPKDFPLVGSMDAMIIPKGPDTILIKKNQPDKEVLILSGKDMKTWQSAKEGITFFARQSTPDSVLESMSNKVIKSIEYLNQSFGQKNPIKTYRVVLRNTTKEELGFQFARNNMMVTGPDFNSFGNLSHEIAHYWWGKADFIKEPWMNESFANYSMFLVMEKYAPANYESLYKQYEATSKEAPSVAQATLFSDNSYNAYYIKGSILLKKLENIIGKDKMLKLLKARLSRQIDNTAGLLKALEAITDQATRQQFEEMLQE
jgi:hypothetical protein